MKHLSTANCAILISLQFSEGGEAGECRSRRKEGGKEKRRDAEGRRKRDNKKEREKKREKGEWEVRQGVRGGR